MVEEPTSDMRQFARAMRDMYVALIMEGFTDVETAQLMGHVIYAGLAGKK